MKASKSARSFSALARAAWLLPLWIGLGLFAGAAHAQVFTVLKNFSPIIVADGDMPTAPLIQGPDGTLYGTTAGGGANSAGTIFKVQPDGSGFTILYGFSACPYPEYLNADGDNPGGGVCLSGSTLYGTTIAGGTNGGGALFSVNTDGSGFTTLFTFDAPPSIGRETSAFGSNPEGGMVISGGVLYGTTSLGGGSGFGTVFSVNTDGSNFKTLYSFTGGTDCGNPFGGLILSGTTLYGTTTGMSSAIADGGTVFQINTDGSGYATIYTFADESVGYNPFGALILSGNTLYGTTYAGGGVNLGTVFSVNTSGGAFTMLAGFDTNPIQFEYPVSSLALINGVLFGTATGSAPYGGILHEFENGTIFSVNTNGTGFKQLYDLPPPVTAPRHTPVCSLPATRSMGPPRAPAPLETERCSN